VSQIGLPLSSLCQTLESSRSTFTLSRNPICPLCRFQPKNMTPLFVACSYGFHVWQPLFAGGMAPNSATLQLHSWWERRPGQPSPSSKKEKEHHNDPSLMVRWIISNERNGLTFCNVAHHAPSKMTSPSGILRASRGQFL
jgi:hypothetical protein